MLFLLKRSVAGSCLGLGLLLPLGLVLRALAGWPVPPLGTPWSPLAGVAVCAAVFLSDGLVHGLLLLFGGGRYRALQRELAETFRGQSLPAAVAGSLMAGLGEELVFRGVTTSPAALACLAGAFGLLHHFRTRLSLFTVWSTWEGLLFAAALAATGELLVVMTAHFLHDLIGFAILRGVRGESGGRTQVRPGTLPRPAKP